MTAGMWFVLCDAARAIPPADLPSRLGPLRDTDIQPSGAALLVVAHDRLTGRDADLVVSLSTEPHVAIESAEIAESLPADSPEHAAIAAASARYELAWDPQLSDEVFNTLAIVADKLSKLTGGVIYDAGARRVV